ncbi:MAG: carboxymuconolactone decarboxylase family protein [Candidatus Dormibacteraeota bacterium]|nr:carboxymuconolactone decarboxylase family protein [Candidatus Dormibacteraeota bacterium]
MKVAVAQLRAALLDAEANARRSVSAIGEASGANLVVLPELMSTGYVLDTALIRPLAESADGTGPVLSAWRVAAREHEVAVVGGFAEAAGNRVYNSAIVIDRHGDVVGHYRKLHLFAGERQVFRPGNLGLPVIELDGMRLGVLICYDLRFPEALRLLALQNADLVAVPTAWVHGFDQRENGAPFGQIEGVIVQANLDQVFVACADLVGATDQFEFLGRSLVVSPYGETLAGPLDPKLEGTVTVTVDLDQARDARERGEGISPRHDRREDVYGPLLGYSIVAPSPAEPTAAADVNSQALLTDMRRKRGYILEIHQMLAAWDPSFLQVYDEFLDASFLDNDVLDRRTRELVYVGSLTAVGSPREHLEAHLRAALRHGATDRELLAVLEQVLPVVGVPRFIEAMKAFREVCGTGPSEGGEP